MSSKPIHAQHVGYTYHDFQLTKSLEIPELQCHFYELIHLPSGAQVMHIANDDPENLFCLSFQTHPDKSDGVAHILEHTVLCGSKKFPIKDPFFMMTRRSLNTFMNALTGSDFTCYPAASQVPKDFYNLLEVYLDAVFHPLINRFSFLQEGHRLEFAIPNDSDSPLEHKGVVFNEMKGALSNPATRLSEAMHAALFPNLTYGINSGGTPSVIPELTYDELKQFHREFYHPSRCIFFFYGSMPLEPHLDFIAKNALAGVEKMASLSPIPRQSRFDKPHYLTAIYPISPDEDIFEKTFISFGWLTCPIIEQQELLALSILEIILLDTDASPLKMALLKSGLCKLVSSHIDTDVSESPVMLTLRGCLPENADACEHLIRSVLHQIVLDGIPLQYVENAIHQLEFYRSEITGDHSPFGLSLFFRSALLKQHQVNAEEGLKIHSLFEAVYKQVLLDPNYLVSLIKKHFLDNPHFVRLVMNPDKELNAQEFKAERDKLDQIRAQMSPKDVKELVFQAEALASFQKQQEEEDVEVLPKVTLSDVPKLARIYDLPCEKLNNLNVYHHACFTNKITYASLIFNLPELTKEELPYVRLLAYIMPQLGSGGRSYTENLEYIQAHTGGIGVSLTLNLQAHNHHDYHPYISIRGKALDRKTHKLFPLIFDLVTSVDFTDLPRINEIIQKHYTSLESTLSSNAMQYAISLSASRLDAPSQISNEWYGLDYYWKIKEIAQNPKHVEVLANQLQMLYEKLFCVENPDLVISSDTSIYDELKGNGFYGLSHMETHPYKPWKNPLEPANIKSQGRLIASPIAFTGKVFKTISYVHPDAPALGVAACLFDNLVLHRKVREIGGAYGGGSVSNAISGSFYFYAYRDPNIASTLKAFSDAVQKVAKGDFEDSDLVEAKLEIIQSLDDPVAPGSRAIHAYGWLREGKTTQVRQAFRDKLLSLTKEEVISAVKSHIIPNMDDGAVVVFAGKELLQKENKKLPEPLPIYKI